MSFRHFRWCITIFAAGKLMAAGPGSTRRWCVATGNGPRLLVRPAHENDRIGGRAALQKLPQQGFERLGLVVADADYDGLPLAGWTRAHCGWRLETSPGLTGSRGFLPLPIRWVVERSSSRLRWDRRLSRDFECETTSAEATIYLSSIRHLIRKF